MNCLLHVPNHDLPAVLAAIRTVLRPGGLFFVGVYGANESAEGPKSDDEHGPLRFFSWRTDEQLLGFAAAWFDVVDFHSVGVGRGHRFQSLTLRRPGLLGSRAEDAQGSRSTLQVAGSCAQVAEEVTSLSEPPS